MEHDSNGNVQVLETWTHLARCPGLDHLLTEHQSVSWIRIVMLDRDKGEEGMFRAPNSHCIRYVKGIKKGTVGKDGQPSRGSLRWKRPVCVSSLYSKLSALPRRSLTVRPDLCGRGKLEDGVLVAPINEVTYEQHHAGSVMSQTTERMSSCIRDDQALDITDLKTSKSG
jgi:hypothetical protein